MKKNKKNLRQKLIPAFIITNFALISQTRLRKSTLENLNMQSEADLQKANQSLNMTLDKYETILYDIATDEEFLDLTLTVWSEDDIMEADEYALRREFAHICNRNDGVDGIQLVQENKKRIFYDRLSSSSVNSTWIGKIEVLQKESLLSHFTGESQSEKTPEPMFHIARKVVDYWDIKKDLGYLVLSVSMDAMDSVVSSGSGTKIYLIENEKIIGAQNTKELGKSVSTLDDRDVNIRKIKNDRSGWTILLCQSAKEYKRAIREQAVFWFLIATIILVVFVLLIYRVTRPVMLSVNEIVSAMKNLEKEKFCNRLSISEQDSIEVQQISEGFNELSERIRNLIEQVKISALEQKNAEISALEAQIDPHFLYNILDTINWKAIENEQYEISDMLVALADILRYAINDAGEITTIGEEKKWLEKYLLLHQEKLGEKIELEFKCEKVYEKYKIHKMLMQPFIENAVKYGFRGQKGEHKIKIECSKAGEQLHILIENNGQLIENEKLKELNQGIEIKNHLGISNVRKRLKLYYGEEAVVYFESSLEQGTKVHLFVPLIGGEEDADSDN